MIFASQKVAFSCLFLFISSLLLGQIPFFHKITKDDGLASTDIFDINQDRDGNMWFFGLNGASRFDGYTIKPFTNQNSGLNAQAIFGSYVDANGHIWVFSYGGAIHVWDGLEWKGFKIDNTGDYVKYVRYIGNELYRDTNDSLWMSFTGMREPMRVGPDGGTLFPRRDDSVHTSLTFKVFKEESYYRCYKAKTKGLTDSIVIELPKQRLVLALKKPQKVKGKGYRLIQTKKGSFYLTTGKNLIKFDKSGILDHRVLDMDINNALVEDRSGDIWIGQPNGIWRFKNGILHDTNATKMLHGKNVTDFFVDHEGGLWLSASGEGVYYAPNPSLITFPMKSLVKNGFLTAMKPRNDTIWIGFNSGEIFYIHNDQTHIIPASTDKKLGYIRKIDFDSEGNLWVAGNNGAFKYENGSFKNYFPNYCTLATDPHQGVWIGWKKGFLHMIDNEIVYEFKNIPLNATVTKMYFGKNDSLWISTNPSFTYIYKDSVLITAKTDLLVPNTSKYMSYSLKKSDNGNLFGTIIYQHSRLFKNHNEIKINQANHTLVHEHSLQDLIEWEGYLWVASLGGLSRFSGTTDKINYTIGNDIGWDYGLLDLEIVRLQAMGNDLWIRSGQGLNKAPKQALEINNSPPPVYIKGIEINNKDTSLLPYYTLLHDQNLITFNFLGISYRARGKLNYKYQLTGVNKDWVITDKTSVQFSTLPSGDYTFSVYAANNDGVWSSEPAKLSFTITPPYWETWWFRLASLLLLIFTIWLLFYIRFRNLRVRMKLTKESLEAEQKALRSQMTPHFMFNALNSIQLLISNNERIFAVKNVAKFARLMRSILDHSEYTVISLKKELEALDLYLELESLRFQGKFTYQINTSRVDQMDQWNIPPMIIQPFIENAIWHGIMKKETPGGEVNVTFRTENNRLYCSIKDDGIGRQKAGEIKDIRIGDSKSTGMRITNERLENLNKQHAWDLQFEIEDLMSENNTPQGTEVKLSFPLIQKVN